MTIRIVQHIQDIPAALWPQGGSPFMRRAFWQALEDSAAIGPQSTWLGQHVVLDDAQGQALAALPLFAKSHNRGEYVFDHAWADAYARHGLNYYPRLVTSAPFTPVTGQRVLLATGVALVDVWPQLFAGVQQIAAQLGASSWHGLFVDEQTRQALLASTPQLAERVGCQFLWQDQNYGSFDGYLAALNAKRRKNIKIERAKVAAQGIRCVWKQGAALTREDWQFFKRCYEMTYMVRGQRPYLNQAFFEQIGRDMPDSLALAMAIDADDQPIAAALFFQDEQTLYGRYWGALAEVDCLHFELCYYQGIEYALSRGLQYFDPGTQGEHKLIRGFAPVLTHSLHWLAEPAFMAAIEDYVAREKVGVQCYFESAMQALPFKKADC
jgi:predicted N-acyltransferase